jgi:hypothetical protein
MNHRLWLAKDNDLAVIGEGTYTWVACGITTNPRNINQVLPCRAGQTPIYTSYRVLTHAIASHALRRGKTVLFDQEGWTATPKWERQRPVYYLGQACQAAHKAGLIMIAAPVGPAG